MRALLPKKRWFFWMLYFLPFVLMRDVYPFFRFSMFATPVSRAAYTERYEWYVRQSRAEKWQLLAPEVIGLDEALFYYRARRANITKQGSAFLAILMEVYRQKREALPAASLLVEKRFKQGQYLDSLVVAQWTRP
ncbi:MULTISPECIES: hypothetical protein [Thermonema]|jgi:hypothetical protein|uniref:hypothetical protein n=1 Tax=Thermonema TaxID=28194 RepID=UPI0012F7FCDE|nr:MULTISPECIES: hypothetical protein [Thermonema]